MRWQLPLVASFAIAIVSCSEAPSAIDEAPAFTNLEAPGLLAYPVTIDGVFDASEWVNPVANPEILLPGGRSSKGRLFFRNDSENLYIGLVFNGDLPDGAVVALGASFFGDGRPPYDEGDDLVVVYSNGLTFDDHVFVNAGDHYRWTDDGLVGGTIDGVGKGLTSGQTTVLEMSHPLNSGDLGFDIATQTGEHLAVRYDIVILLEDGSQVRSPFFYIYHYLSCVRHQGYDGRAPDTGC